MMNWMEMLFKIKSEIPEEKYNWISYMSTVNDSLHKFSMIEKDIISVKKDIKKILRSVYIMLTDKSERKRIHFYYANNPISLISKNKKGNDLKYESINSDIEFINPYDIPESLKTPPEKLTDIIKCLCFATIITINRVIKYQTKPNKACFIRDSDSTMPNMYSMVMDILKIFGKENLMSNDNVQIRMTMIFVSR